MVAILHQTGLFVHNLVSQFSYALGPDRYTTSHDQKRSHTENHKDQQSKESLANLGPNRITRSSIQMHDQLTNSLYVKKYIISKCLRKRATLMGMSSNTRLPISPRHNHPQRV